MMCSTQSLNLKYYLLANYELLCVYKYWGVSYTSSYYEQQGELVARRLEEYVTAVKVNKLLKLQLKSFNIFRIL